MEIITTNVCHKDDNEKEKDEKVNAGGAVARDEGGGRQVERAGSNRDTLGITMRIRMSMRMSVL